MPVEARRSAGGVVAVLHQHADHEGREQHLDVDAVFGAVPVGRRQIEQLRQGADRDGEAQDAFPVLLHVPGRLPPPPDGEQDAHRAHDGEHLPFEADHQDLQRDHQQDGVQIVEDRQHLYFTVDPALFQVQRREHREEDARRGRGRETAQQQVLLLPRRGASPQVGGQQHEDVIEGDEQPRKRRGGHSDEVIGGVGAPAGLVDLELPADVDHNEPQTDVEQRVGRGLEARIGCAQCAGKQLRGDEAQHQEERERKNFSH